ncbi:hypothetical protein [Desertivirga xinjiangensis]|uniref:hypothetical protein n=1 Tax=Desertivirga xinjiangensis TaxID=539206 RepID=UPI00210AAE31|nr:hypothetical protein [Pedobacter xinjiangensis]
MKNFKFLAVLFVAVSVGFTSCKKDDDAEIDMAALKGTWQKTKVVETFYDAQGKQSEQETYTDYDSEDRIQVTDNRIIYDGGLYAENYKVEGDKIIASEIGGSSSSEYEIKIKKLTSTELVTEYEDKDEDGSREVIEETFKKVN